MAKDEFKPPKGMDDIGPEEMAIQDWMTTKIRKIFRRYGFQLVEPTMVEEFRTLAAKSGPAIKDEIYYFKDKAGRELGLRFDLTVGIARMVANHPHWPLPIRLGAISSMWRYDQPAYGRRRWFFQWNVEILGEQSVLADFESIAVGIDIFRELGYEDFEVRIGHRQVAEGILKSLGADDKNVIELLRWIDKLQKVSRDEILSGFEENSLSRKTGEEVLQVLKRGRNELLDEINDRFGDVDSVSRGVDDLKQLLHFFEVINMSKHVIIDLSIVRGLGYYTGPVWEAYDLQDERAGALFGGGRYDSLVGLYGGRDLPATGTAGGLLRAMMVLKQRNLIPKEVTPKPHVFVVNLTEDLVDEAMKVARTLREEGVSSVFNISKWKARKALDYANKIGVPKVVLIGKKELEENRYILRDMVTGEQALLTLDQLRDALKKTFSLPPYR